MASSNGKPPARGAGAGVVVAGFGAGDGAAGWAWTPGEGWVKAAKETTAAAPIDRQVARTYRFTVTPRRYWTGDLAPDAAAGAARGQPD